MINSSDYKIFFDGKRSLIFFASIQELRSRGASTGGGDRLILSSQALPD
ncbi:MAG: hypothetical protein HWQ43_12945 [Nostoc sp. JL31]|nr:hypothetical protein [Nostoc sp. JL31]MBN3890031.1 hypothetical protein [Nostoc sp. JL31]